MVTINLETDELIPVSKLVQTRLGRRIAPATLWRWRTKGTRGVRLPMVLVLGSWCSTPKALTEFLRESSEAGMPQPAPPVERDEATNRRLQAAGLV